MIYGIGLPRTGTSTLAEALRLLGLQGDNYCGLYNKLRSDKGADFVVNNVFYNKLDELISMSKPEDKFILTTRDTNKWRRSIAKFPENENIPDIEEYNLDAFFKLEKAKKPLEVLNWEEDGWEVLCEFLDKPIPDYAFPCINC